MALPRRASGCAADPRDTGREHSLTENEMQIKSSQPGDAMRPSVRDAISPHLLSAFIFSILVNSLFLASPLYMMQLYGRVLDSRSIETLVALSVALVLALVAMAAADAARGRILTRAASRLERRLIPASSDDGAGYAGRLADLAAIRSFLAGSAALTLFDAPFTMLFLLVLFLLHPILGLVATLGAAIILAAVVIGRLINRDRDSRIQSGQAGLESLTRVIDRDHGNLRALGAEPGLMARLQGGMSEIRGLRQNSGEHMASLGAFNRFVRMAAHSASLATGAILTLRGDLPPAAMLAAAILAGRALGPMESLPTAWRQASAAKAAFGRLGKKNERSVSAVEPQTDDGAATVSIRRAMVLPKGARRAALRNVTIEIAAGEAISIAGATGSGKSMLARAMAGIEPLSSGQIRVSGHDPARLDSRNRAERIGWMPQDVTLYPGTIAENIARFTDAPQSEYVAAAERAGARALIEQLPDGFATEVGSGGSDLSPGMCQRVALARALMGAPSLVILDQPTAHMDADGEVATLNAIRSLKDAGVTVVVISHKPVLAALADKILVMRDGTVDLFEARETVIDAMRRQSLAPVARSKTPARPQNAKEVTQ